jgi:hypothetical protein
MPIRDCCLPRHCARAAADKPRRRRCIWWQRTIGGIWYYEPITTHDASSCTRYTVDQWRMRESGCWQHHAIPLDPQHGGQRLQRCACDGDRVSAEVRSGNAAATQLRPRSR